PRCLGEYRLLGEIGRGGMGVVYEAVQESLGRHVALKVLFDRGPTKESFRERFRCEARSAGRLHHTNIVPVFGTGECDGVLYYAMQYIPGQAVDRVLDDVRRLRRHPARTEGGQDRTAAYGLLSGTFAPPPDDLTAARAPPAG